MHVNPCANNFQPTEALFQRAPLILDLFGIKHLKIPRILLTITPINRKTQKLEFKQGERAKISESTEQIETPISKFNFDSLVEYIISHSALADQNLMKYAVSYRFAHSVVNGKEQDIEAENEDSRLQDAIIKSIVRTYNQLRKYLKMDYVQYELETGELQFLES